MKVEGEHGKKKRLNERDRETKRLLEAVCVFLSDCMYVCV